MGADLFLCDPHRIIVTGPKRLRGRPLDSRDLRSGMVRRRGVAATDRAGSFRSKPSNAATAG
jgi:UDP-N-acetylglucosamine 1-carboxyvinyltransferase